MNEQQFSDLLKKLKIPTNNRSYADIFDLLDAKLSEYLDRQDTASQELIDDIQDALDYAEIKKNEVGSGIALKREDDAEEEDGTDLDELRAASKKALEEANGQASALHDALNAALSAATQQTQQMNQVAWRRAGKLWFSSVTGADNINTMFFQALDDLKYGEFDHAKSIFEAILQVEPNNASAYLGKLMAIHKLKDLRDIGNSYDKDIFSDINMRRAYDHGDNQQKQYLDDARKEVESGKKYKDADRMAQDTNDEAAQEEAARLFGELGTYRDAPQRKAQCTEAVRELKYSRAVMTNKKAYTSVDYRKAAALYKEVSGYKNADNLAAECEAIAKRKEDEEEEKKRLDGIKTHFKGLQSQYEAVANPILKEYQECIRKGKEAKIPYTMEELQKRLDALKNFAKKFGEVYSYANAEEVLASADGIREEIAKLSANYEENCRLKKNEKKSDLLVALAVIFVLYIIGFPAAGGKTLGLMTGVPVRTTHEHLYVKNGTSSELTSFSKFSELTMAGSGLISRINCPRAEIEKMTLKGSNYSRLEIPDTVKELVLDGVTGCQIPESVELLYITGRCNQIEIPATVKRVEIVNARLDELHFPDGVQEIKMDTVTTYNEVGIPHSVYVADINNITFDVYYE